MRVTSNMYYKNVFGESNSRLSQSLFDVNKQIASGIKIQYAQEDIRTFTETMRLDNEITTLDQSKNSITNALKFSNQTDSVLNEFSLSMDRMKTLLINASNAANSETSLDAISQELRGLEDHLKNLANTSINGQYLFSGSAIDTKPISDDGSYNGNAALLKAFGGSGISQQYNINGQELFLGEEKSTKREITSNVVQTNLTKKYPDFLDTTVTGTTTPITSSDTIRDLMGDTDNLSDGITPKHFFYANGVRSDGSSFKEKFAMGDNDKISDLLVKIGDFYGNTPEVSVVNVSMNAYGEIVVEDKMKGSSKIDFHMVGATDFENGGTALDAADVTNINALNGGETNFDNIILGISTAANPNLHVKNFVKSDFAPTQSFATTIPSIEFSMDGAVLAGDTLSITINNGDSTTTTITQPFNTDAATTYEDLKNQIESLGDFLVNINGNTIELVTTPQGITDGVFIDTNLANDNVGITTTTTTSSKSVLSDIQNTLYDNTAFTKDGAKVTSNVSQIIKGTNVFATSSTKLSEVADLTQGTSGTLDGTSFVMEGKDINGNSYTAQIDLATAGSTFSLDGGVTNYTIYNMGSPRVAVKADEMTYKQLSDVVNMVVTGNLPAITLPATTNTDAEYDSAIVASDLRGKTYLTNDGKLEFRELNVSSTKATVSLYDSSSGDFSVGADASVMTFNSNNALTVSDPKTDFFKTIDEIISSVENYKLYPDSSSGDVRSMGTENAIAMIDDLKEHIGKSHSQVGAQSNTLTKSLERVEMLKMSSIELRSSVIDTDLAEASLTLAQLNTNYQAMLSTVSKISKLSLVNYL